MSSAPTHDQQRYLDRIEDLFAVSGMDLAILTAHLEAVSAGRAASEPGTTVASLVETALKAGKPGTVRTYGTYWRLFAFGLRQPGFWDNARLAEWARDAEAANREKDLGLEIDVSATSYPRLRDDEDKTWIQIVPGYGGRHPGTITMSDVEILEKWVWVNALADLAGRNRRRAARGEPAIQGHGKGARENFIAAIRSLYRRAAADNLVQANCSPAADIAKPKRQATRSRRSMTESELADVWLSSSTTGDDPELDAALFEFHADTGSRPEGAINLKLRHLVRDGIVKGVRYRNAIVLDQKRDKLTVVPVRASLLDLLEKLARSRGSSQPEDPVFRYRGRHRHTGERHPRLSHRRHDTWYGRVRGHHAWAREEEWTAYWLRHHTAEQVEALAGRDAKRIFLGHEPDGVTDGYGPSHWDHVAWALSQLTGEDHPDARPPSRS
jgi:site-specific recombinase XerD